MATVPELNLNQELRRVQSFFVIKENSDELQDLLRRCYVNQQRLRKAKLFGYWFTGIGLAVAGFLYLVKFEHWWGIW